LLGCPSELGFAARRFAPLEENGELEEAENEMLIPVGADR
jgi:hypothetical protein